MIRGVERAGDGALSVLGGVRIEHLDALTCRFPSGSWSSRNQQKLKTLHPFPKANDANSLSAPGVEASHLAGRLKQHWGLRWLSVWVSIVCLLVNRDLGTHFVSRCRERK